MAQWSIKILSNDSALQFQPDLPGAQVGDPLKIISGDIVIWNNLTDGTVTLSNSANGDELVEVPGGQVSSPGLIINLQTPGLNNNTLSYEGESGALEGTHSIEVSS